MKSSNIPMQRVQDLDPQSTINSSPSLS